MITFKKLKFGRSGLGNLLFQYAGTRLYAERNGFSFSIPEWIGCAIFQGIKPWTGYDQFKARFIPQVQLSDIKSYTRSDILKWLLEKNSGLPKTRTATSLYEKPRDNISLFGYLQDEFSIKLLIQNRDRVKSWFKFKDSLDSKFREISKPHVPWIGVHIRKGDFVNLGIDLPTHKYAEKLREVKKEFPDHKVFIATNDRGVVKDFEDFELLDIDNPDKSMPGYIFDFWMLVNADIMIGGGSTFSWWAAYLSKNEYYYSPPLTHTWTENYEPKFDKIYLK